MTQLYNRYISIKILREYTSLYSQPFINLFTIYLLPKRTIKISFLEIRLVSSFLQNSVGVLLEIEITQRWHLLWEHCEVWEKTRQLLDWWCSDFKRIEKNCLGLDTCIEKRENQFCWCINHWYRPLGVAVWVRCDSNPAWCQLLMQAMFYAGSIVRPEPVLCSCPYLVSPVFLTTELESGWLLLTCCIHHSLTSLVLVHWRPVSWPCDLLQRDPRPGFSLTLRLIPIIVCQYLMIYWLVWKNLLIYWLGLGFLQLVFG